MNISYLIAMFWQILLEFIADFNMDIEDLREYPEEADTFIYYFELQDNSSITNLVT